MAKKVMLLADPGIDGAFAIALALHDPNLDVLGIGAVAGNVSADQATNNVHILLNQFDPKRLPRVGAGIPTDYPEDGRAIHGPQGLGALTFPDARRHNLLTAEKLLVELAKDNPGELTIICMGPATTLARALDFSAELPHLVQRIVMLGGSMHEPGNAGPVSEFHFWCDPAAAHQVLHCGAPITLIPLDLMRKALFSPTDLLELPADSPTRGFLRRIAPYGIAATSNLYGIEGFHLKDVLGVIGVALPDRLHVQSMAVDVESAGALTRGMSVFDRRAWVRPIPNVEVAVDVDRQGIRDYMRFVLSNT
ncbi:MAG: nucleoside hydrolase [Gemmataceae bacterium]|nr:nucleoside hydrolase [Gemmataceae bacterium]